MSKVIYEPKGKAREYGELAVNLYNGCSHGCKYCYVPLITKRDRLEFSKYVKERKNILESIREEAPLYKGREVFMSFTSDPYQAIDKELEFTREAIKVLNRKGVAVCVLTKAGKASERDFDLLAKRKKNRYGATLTFLDEERSLRVEPKAATPKERLSALRKAHKLGIPTWVSLEPVLDPQETLNIIKKTHKFVDMFKVGKLNHDSKAGRVDWHKFGHDAVALLKKYGKDYYIKKDLRALM